jgi:hypothetical protein
MLFWIKGFKELHTLYGFLLYWFSAITLYFLISLSTILHTNMVIDAWFIFKKDIVFRKSFQAFTILYFSSLVLTMFYKYFLILSFIFGVFYFFLIMISLENDIKRYHRKINYLLKIRGLSFTRDDIKDQINKISSFGFLKDDLKGNFIFLTLREVKRNNDASNKEVFNALSKLKSYPPLSSDDEIVALHINHRRVHFFNLKKELIFVKDLI